MKIVLHFNYFFFLPSETFIYNIVKNHIAFQPILAALSIKNLDRFPFPRRDTYKVGIPFSRPGISMLLPNKMIVTLNVRHLIHRLKPDLLHAHYGPWGCLMLPLKRTLDIPLIVTFYGYDVTLTKRRRMWKEEYGKLFRLVDLFLVEGPFMKQSLEELGCPGEKIRIQKIGIDLPKPTSNQWSSLKTIHITFAGRFVTYKGILDALKAIKLLRNDFNNFEFTIIGSGPLMLDIKRFIHTNTMNSYVNLSGFLSYNDYIDRMRNSHIFLHPSQTTQDGITEGGAPTTILEAQALGIPVVSTLHADIPNIVVPQKSALLSPEGDVNGIYQNLSYLLQNPSYLKPMGEVGRKYVIQNHCVDKTIKELEKKYTSIL